MDFQVTILGSGSAIPTSRRKPTSQFVQCRNRNILIDCGEGTQMRIREEKIKFQRIEYILISHLHGDHYFGLVGLLSTMHLLGRTSKLIIAGPEELENIVRVQLDAGHSVLGYNIEFIALEPNFIGVVLEDDKFAVKSFPLKHKIPTHGYRIEEKERERKLLVEKCEADGILIEHYQYLKKGEDVEFEGKTIKYQDYTIESDAPASYAFCSDTAFFEDIVKHIEGVTTLYHEATFEEAYRDRAKATKHSTGKDAATIAAKAKVGNLLLGHLSARHETGELIASEAKEIFENVTYVNDGDVFIIK